MATSTINFKLVTDDELLFAFYTTRTHLRQYSVVFEHGYTGAIEIKTVSCINQKEAKNLAREYAVRIMQRGWKFTGQASKIS